MQGLSVIRASHGLHKRYQLLSRSLSTVNPYQHRMDSIKQSQSAPMTHQKFSGRKRFYKKVDVQSVNDNEFRIALDGRVLRTPGRNPLVFASKDLAIAIAAEWDAQTDEKKGIEPVTMPLMTLASTAIDQIRTDRHQAIANCMKYLPTDSALFFTTDNDRILLAKQRKHLTPVIRWVSRLLRVDLQTTTNMSSKIVHPPETVSAFEKMLNGMDDFTLACMQNATSECKSIILATAYLGRFLTLQQARTASRLEEEFQVEIWGVVEGGHDMDRLNNSVNLSSLGVFMNLGNLSLPKLGASL